MLLHEAWLKFARADMQGIDSSGHLVNIFAAAMRQLVTDSARSRATVRHGAQFHRVDLDDSIPSGEHALEDLLAVDRALVKLQACDADLARLVEWRFFAGLPLGEIARLQGESESTVKRQWNMARALLQQWV